MCRVRRGFEYLSSSIRWRVMALQSFTKKAAQAGLKGYSNTKKAKISVPRSPLYITVLLLVFRNMEAPNAFCNIAEALLTSVVYSKSKASAFCEAAKCWSYVYSAP